MQGGSPLLGKLINSQSRKMIVSLFNGVKMNLTYGKLVRASFLLLFLISTITCLVKPGAQSGLVAILSLIAFVAFDVVCALKRPAYKDFTADMEAIQKRNTELEKQFKEIKDELSVGGLSSLLTRRK